MKYHYVMYLIHEGFLIFQKQYNWILIAYAELLYSKMFQTKMFHSAQCIN